MTFIWLGGQGGIVPCSALGMVVGMPFWGVGVMCEGETDEIHMPFIDGIVP